MSAAAETLSTQGRGKKRRAARARTDELPVRIGGMEYARTASTPSRLLGFDQSLIWVCVALLAWGCNLRMARAEREAAGPALV